MPYQVWLSYDLINVKFHFTKSYFILMTKLGQRQTHTDIKESGTMASVQILLS